jgi:hypothetical protein
MQFCQNNILHGSTIENERHLLCYRNVMGHKRIQNLKIRSISLWRRRINIRVNIILSVIHRPVFYLKHDVSETGFCLRLQVIRTQLSPFDVYRYHLRTETESSHRNVVLYMKDRKMDNAQIIIAMARFVFRDLVLPLPQCSTVILAESSSNRGSGLYTYRWSGPQK